MSRLAQGLRNGDGLPVVLRPRRGIDTGLCQQRITLQLLAPYRFASRYRADCTAGGDKLLALDRNTRMPMRIHGVHIEGRW